MSVFNELQKESEKLGFDMYENVDPKYSNKVCFVLRSVSGAGKTTLAELLDLNWQEGKTVEICEADDYFYNGQEYKFDSRELGNAHKHCRNKFEKCLDSGINLVIVSNTNTRWENEAEFYVNLAKQKGYTVFSLVLENINETKDIHGLSDETKLRQKTNLMKSVKLM